jgi:rhodanese-related sulfurtransferase
MLKVLIFTTYFLAAYLGFAQSSLSEVLKKYNSESIPYITADQLLESKDKVIILDARERAEYNVSHLNDAVHVGYEDFDLEAVTKTLGNTSKTIVVYCSIGVRSEDIAEELKAAGYTDVYNLFGGIFNWKNASLPIYNSNNKATDSIHAYSKKWGKWLKQGIKVYE